ncbi:unnamed protein product, partial [Didymodactylos carnosus]
QPIPLAELIVEPRPVTVQRMEMPREVFYIEEQLTLEAEFPKAPKDQPQWFKNGLLIRPNDHHVIQNENGNRKHSLIINHLKPDDTGSYELRVKGLIIETPLIKVVERPQRLTDQLQEQPSGFKIEDVTDQYTSDNIYGGSQPIITDADDESHLKPEYIQRRLSTVVIEEVTDDNEIRKAEEPSKQTTQTVREGDSIKLKVISTLDVQPNQIRLLRDGLPIETNTKSSSIRIERQSVGTYVVSFLNLRVSDSGRYDYQIDSKAPQKHLVTLYVEPRPQPKTKLINLPQDTFIVGGNVQFTIDFDDDTLKNNIQPEWYRNEVFIPFDYMRHRQTIDVKNRKYTFEIFDLQPADAGVYEMRTPSLIVRTPEIKITPRLTRLLDEQPIETSEENLRRSSVTIDMNRAKEIPL